MFRNPWIVSVWVMVLVVVWLGCATAEATPVDRLTVKYGLLTAIPIQVAWIDYVFDKVDAGELPLSLVQKTFDWSRKRTPHQRFMYFQWGLIRLAAAKGIRLHQTPPT